MTPRAFIESGNKAQREHEKRIQQIELAHERAVLAAERAYARRLAALEAKRLAALKAARDALYEVETRDYDALHAAGHTYDEVKALRSDATLEHLHALPER